MDAAPPALECLFTPFQLGEVVLPNRLVMAPMTRELSWNGVLPVGAAAYYARRAVGGVGLIVTEGAAIPHDVAHYSRSVPHFYGEAALAAWRVVADRVHDVGGKIFPQIWHSGGGRRRDRAPNPSAPSIAASARARNAPRAMTDGDIADVIAAFGQAARSAQVLGFDGVAIHGAHGYLIDSFFWKEVNDRRDRYGGNIAQRALFGCEIVREIRRQVGGDFPIMFRFSQFKGYDWHAKVAATPAELERWLIPLAEAGVSIFDASTRRFWQPEFETSPLNLAGWAKKITGKPSVTVGSVGLEGPLDGVKLTEMGGAAVSTSNLSVLAEMLQGGGFDLVALGRILLANPEWPRLVRAGRFEAINPYEPDLILTNLEPARLSTK